MRRGLVVAFAIAATLLAISAMPVAAQNASAVASEHTTFGSGSAGEPSPTTLTNMSVEGSGESASVAFGTTTLYNPVDAEGDGDAETTREFIGDTLNNDAFKSSVAIEPDAPGEITTLKPQIGAVDGSDYGVTVDIYISKGDADESYKEGTLVKSNFDPDFSTGEQTISLDTPFSVSAGTKYEVEFISSGTDSDGTRDSIYMRADGSGGGGWYRFLRFDEGAYGDLSARIEPPPAPGRYVGARHDAENVNTGFANLTLQNANADVIWQEDADGDGAYNNVSTTTYTTSGNKTADLSATTSDRWRVRIDIDKTGPNPTAQINDEGVLSASANPTLSDPEPPGQAKIENAVGNVSINVSDSDFGLVQGDTITVSATDDDGTSLGSTTVTGNGRVSLPYTSENGRNVIDWQATDEYGNTDTFRQTFTTPSTLIIRNESAPSQVINTTSNVTVTFFDRSGQNIIKRSSTNGRIDLSGIPTDTEYVIQVDAAGFRSRQVIITSLFDQQNVYLLPTSRAAATVEFQLNDQTSRFPSDETTLFVQKPITRNNSTEFRTVFADQFGATDSLRVDLRDQERYRIQVRNDQGETRVLESFTTSGDAVAPLTIGSVEVSGSVDERGVAFASDVIERDGARLLRITYQDPTQQTAAITVQVRQNGSQVVPNITGTAGYGRFVTTVNITGRTTAEDYNVTFGATRDGQTISGGDVGGGVGELSFGLDPFLRQLIGWGAILALTGLVVIRSPRLAPATGTLTGTMLTIIGVLTIPAPALGIAGAISVLSVYSRGGGA